MKQRLQKLLSLAGVASRRKAEELISKGAVTVNGKVAELGDKADPLLDQILVNGARLQLPTTEDKIYIALNKPKGYVSSRSDPENRKTIYELLPAEIRKLVWSIGRLDFQTEGLILLTNDGELTQQLSHPSFEHEKEYEVVVDKTPTQQQLELLSQGVKIDGKKTYPAEVKMATKSCHACHPDGGRDPDCEKNLASRQNSKSTKIAKDLKTTHNSNIESTIINITIHEGRNRQVRKMIEAVGLKVKSLKRIRIGKLKLGRLPLGKYMAVQKNDILYQR